MDALTSRFHQYLREGYQTPFNQLREVMHLSYSFVLAQGSLRRIHWLNDDGTSLLIDGTRLDLHNLSHSLKNGIAIASNHLYEKILLKCVVDASDKFYPTYDDMRNTAPGWSLLSLLMLIQEAPLFTQIYCQR